MRPISTRTLALFIRQLTSSIPMILAGVLILTAIVPVQAQELSPHTCGNGGSCHLSDRSREICQMRVGALQVDGIGCTLPISSDVKMETPVKLLK